MRKSEEKDNAEDAKKSREEHGDFVIRGGNHKWNLRRHSASRYRGDAMRVGSEIQHLLKRKRSSR